MMRALVWGVAAAALGVWSLLAWGLHSLSDTAGDWAAANADRVSSTPEVIESLSSLLGGVGDAGQVVVVIGWLIGVIAIVLVAAIAHRLIARGGRLPKFLRRLSARS